jgi:DMSO/TMAO reductase YedYZ molybdopterin-dependent catalytic subunit
MPGDRESQHNPHGDALEPEWLHGHAHEPNPDPPTEDATFALSISGHEKRAILLSDLDRLPQTEVRDCYIVSTGHGTSGPHAFAGVRLADLLAEYLPAGILWTYVDVLSADGFGNRVVIEELESESGGRPILLATKRDGKPITRAEGLVRLIVPSETDDALRQVKWIEYLEVR